MLISGSFGARRYMDVAGSSPAADPRTWVLHGARNGKSGNLAVNTNIKFEVSVGYAFWRFQKDSMFRRLVCGRAGARYIFIPRHIS